MSIEQPPLNNLFDWYNGLDDDVEYQEEEVKMLFAIAIDNQMKRADISKSQLAERCKTSRSNITQLLRGDRNLRMSSMVNLAHHLGVKVSISLHEKHDGKSKMSVFGSAKSINKKNAFNIFSAHTASEIIEQLNYVNGTESSSVETIAS